MVRPAEPKPPSRSPYVALFFVFCIFVVGAFFPDKRLWGINHLSFYPPVVRLVLIALAAAVLIPAVGRRVAAFSVSTVEKLSALSPARASVGPLVVAIGAFLIFHASTLLFGDGMLTETSLRLGIDNKFSLGQFASIVLRDEHISPGTDILNFIAAIIGHGAGLDAVWSVRILNALIGVGFVYAIIRYGSTGGDPPLLRATVMALLLTGGFVQLFFGYVEQYTPLALGGVLFVMVGMAHAADGRRTGLAVAIVAVSMVMHIFAVLFLPALAFLILAHAMRSRENFQAGRLAGGICGVVVIGAVALLWLPVVQRYVIKTVAGGAYGVLSTAHLADMANLLLLVLPALPVIVALAVDRSARDGDPAGLVQRGFAWCLLVPAAIFLLMFRPELGMARDWDLFSMTSFGIFAFAYVVLKRSIAGAPDPPARRVALTGSMLALSAVLAVAWIGINASDSRSLARYESILAYDKTKAGYAYESLAQYHNRRGNVQAYKEAVKTAYDESGNLRYLLQLCVFFKERGDVDNAVGGLLEVLRRDPGYEEARVLLIRILEESGDHGTILQVAREGAERAPKNPLYPFVLGKAYLGLGMVAEAKVAFQQCISLNPPDAMVSEIARIVHEASEPPPGQE